MSDRNDGPYIIRDAMKPHASPIDGTVIDSRQQRREHLKQNGCADARDYETGSQRKERIERKQELVARQGGDWRGVRDE